MENTHWMHLISGFSFELGFKLNQRSPAHVPSTRMLALTSVPALKLAKRTVWTRLLTRMWLVTGIMSKNEKRYLCQQRFRLHFCSYRC
jgi:hypothetical protein